MPWCPECGAEYSAGPTTCTACAIALVDERPAAMPRGLRTPPFLVRPLADAASAIRFAVSALRLLRRHPSLLLLPLAIVVFNVVERSAGDYAMYRYTVIGRERAKQGQVAHMPIMWPSGYGLWRFGMTVYEFAEPVPGIALGGTARAVFAALDGPLRDNQSHSRLTLTILGIICPLAAALFTALLLSGYLGVAGATVTEGKPPWSRFGYYVRRYWLRFWLLFVVFMALAGGFFVIGFLLSFREWILEWVLRAGEWWATWLGPVIAFLLALARYAIVVDDASVMRAIKRSAATVIGRIVTALILLLAFAACEAAVLAPLSSVANSFAVRHQPSGLAVALLSVIPWRVAAEGWQAVLGVWLCLAMFYWYRDANRPSAPEPVVPSVERSDPSS